MEAIYKARSLIKALETDNHPKAVILVGAISVYRAQGVCCNEP